MLKAAINDVETFDFVWEGVEHVSRTISRCAILESLYLHQNHQAKPDIQNAVIQLYASILTIFRKPLLTTIRTQQVSRKCSELGQFCFQRRVRISIEFDSPGVNPLSRACVSCANGVTRPAGLRQGTCAPAMYLVSFSLELSFFPQLRIFVNGSILQAELLVRHCSEL